MGRTWLFLFLADDIYYYFRDTITRVLVVLRVKYFFRYGLACLKVELIHIFHCVIDMDNEAEVTYNYIIVVSRICMGTVTTDYYNLSRTKHLFLLEVS